MIKLLIRILLGLLVLAWLFAAVHNLWDIGKKEGIVKGNYEDTEEEENE